MRISHLLLIAAIILSLSVCQQCTEKKTNGNILDISDMNFGWLDEYDSISHHIAIKSPWGGRGWIFGDEADATKYFDASEYDHVVVDLKNITGTFGNLSINIHYVGTDLETRDLSTIVGGATTMRIELDPICKSKVKCIFIMSDAPCEMDITSACFAKKLHYGKPKELKMSDIGIVSADQFENYSDNALVEMVFATEGDIMGVDQYGDYVDMTGWNVGIICSAADVFGAELPTRGIVLQKLGIQKYKCLLGDIRYLLSQADDDGERGIYWTVWKLGGITSAKVLSTTIAEVVD